MTPYSRKPPFAFWRRSVRPDTPYADFVVNPSFGIGAQDQVATVGSCFAQHLVGTLPSLGLVPMTTEPPLEGGAAFPARFGNIYAVRQLLQLLDRAYGLFAPQDTAWRRADGRYVDPFRPLVHTAGFEAPEDVLADQALHLEAVRRMFEDCDVFIFTLGLTEQWRADADGAVVPLVPQAVAKDTAAYSFHNASVAEMTADLARFVTRLRLVNPAVRILLTVSPVALAATFEDRHVLVANTYSKAALRVTADETSGAFPLVDYFPSYEMVTGPQSRGRWLADDLREVTQAGVDQVMAAFAASYVGTPGANARPQPPPIRLARSASSAEEAHVRRMQAVICDEDLVERTA